MIYFISGPDPDELVPPPWEHEPPDALPDESSLGAAGLWLVGTTLVISLLGSVVLCFVIPPELAPPHSGVIPLRRELGPSFFSVLVLQGLVPLLLYLATPWYVRLLRLLRLIRTPRRAEPGEVALSGSQGFPCALPPAPTEEGERARWPLIAAGTLLVVLALLANAGWLGGTGLGLGVLLGLPSLVMGHLLLVADQVLEDVRVLLPLDHVIRDCRVPVQVRLVPHRGLHLGALRVVLQRRHVEWIAVPMQSDGRGPRWNLSRTQRWDRGPEFTLPVDTRVEGGQELRVLGTLTLPLDLLPMDSREGRLRSEWYLQLYLDVSRRPDASYSFHFADLVGAFEGGRSGLSGRQLRNAPNLATVCPICEKEVGPEEGLACRGCGILSHRLCRESREACPGPRCEERTTRAVRFLRARAG